VLIPHKKFYLLQLILFLFFFLSLVLGAAGSLKNIAISIYKEGIFRLYVILHTSRKSGGFSCRSDGLIITLSFSANKFVRDTSL